MGNPEHLEILKQGVDVWNRWREDNPDVKPDLSNMNLDNARLFNVRFEWTNLEGSSFEGSDICYGLLRNAYMRNSNLKITNLYRSDIRETYLRRADLSGANLSETNIFRANLSVARLNGSNLEKARIRMSDLTGVEVDDANFNKSRIGYTVLVGIDFRKAIGLENINHEGPCNVGIDTIYQSGGKIPETFLRGCGVPENFIQYIPSLVNQPIQFYSCFISYSSKDQAFADRLHSDLQNKGVRCWYAPEDMKIGDPIRDRIDQSIRVHDKLLLILSENSIDSGWVDDEVESAYEKEKNRGSTVLFPIRLDDALMDAEKAWAAKLRRSRHIGDFTRWKDQDEYQKAFDRLLRDLRAED